MAVNKNDVTYAPVAFAAIEVKGKIYFVRADIAKGVKKALSDQMVFTSAEGPIHEALSAASEFVIDAANGTVLKPTP